ncbi:HET-domain-containing protein [Astrocystis sublimbata]|nr:HET-domain-containing protein [Astrocystis sublimbata]
MLPTHRDITSVEYDGEGSFQTALQWIENCRRNHNCSNAAKLPTLPTRVIDTALLGGPVRLVARAARREQYVCLSHCWGQAQQLTTTSQTLESHMNGIDWDCIPATYKDTIVVCRKLGIRYVWIDSLCIIQDSVEDWERESSRMAEIYSNSYITIAAAASRNGEGGLGLHSPRQSGTTLKGTARSGAAYNIHVQYSLGNNATLHEHPGHGIRHPLPMGSSVNNDFSGVLQLFPLLTRGWVLQERLLSPRFLQFGQYELLWDCAESLLCECAQRPLDLLFNKIMVTSKNRELLPHKWRKIVEFYSTLNLTFSKDKLPALSGLARQMMELKPGAHYLAGLWKDSLDLDLLWIPYGPEALKSNDRYIAPSWSWASVARKIVYPNRWRPTEDKPHVKTLATYFELVEATCTPSSADPTGKVAGGSLIVRSPLYVISTHSSREHASVPVELRYGEATFFPCTEKETPVLLNNWRIPFAEKTRKVFLDHPDTFHHSNYKGNLYACRISRVEILERSSFFLLDEALDTIHIEFSLLLQPVDDGGHLFRRIGLLADGRCIDGHGGDADSWSKDPSCFEVAAEGGIIEII